MDMNNPTFRAIADAAEIVDEKTGKTYAVLRDIRGAAKALDEAGFKGPVSVPLSRALAWTMISSLSAVATAEGIAFVAGAERSMETEHDDDAADERPDPRPEVH